jgi:hypothetical protein
VCRCTKPIYLARQWGEPFKGVQPTVSFPRFLVDRAAEGGSVIKLDDPAMWVDRRGYWHVIAHNGDGPFPCGDPGPLGLAFRDGNANLIGCSAHLYSCAAAAGRTRARPRACLRCALLARARTG